MLYFLVPMVNMKAFYMLLLLMVYDQSIALSISDRLTGVNFINV